MSEKEATEQVETVAELTDAMVAEQFIEDVTAAAEEGLLDGELGTLIQTYRSLAHTQGRDQTFEYEGKTVTVFQDGTVQLPE